MDTMIFNSCLRKRKDALHLIAKSEPSWKYRKLLAISLFVLSILIIGAVLFLLLLNPTDATGVFIFICFAVIMACVPFFIAISTKNKAKYVCAYPYSSYANGILVLKEHELQYLFWQVGPREPAAYSSPRAIFNDEDKFIYQINKDAISKIVIDEKDICTIWGLGNIAVPKWAKIPKSEIKELSKEFSFVLDFEDDSVSKIIKNWRNNYGE